AEGRVLHLDIDQRVRCVATCSVAARLDIGLPSGPARCGAPFAVVVVRRPELRAPTESDCLAFTHLKQAYAKVGMTLLDVIVIDEHRWRSLAEADDRARTTHRPRS